ncbi:hypothetical protein HK104_008930 [Borealophlyctis nickersoniae]|nr:hypothetical protein HK104_008930 [Borealophlyctis nickersoniae]
MGSSWLYTKPLKSGVKFPKRMPTNWVLKQISFPPPKSWFEPSVTLDGRTRPPKISGGNQHRIREACLMAGLPPEETVGLPPFQFEEKIDPVPRGSHRVVEKYEREKKIAENMATMPERIAAWREEKRRAKEAAKSDMPF